MTLFKREWQLISANPTLYMAPFIFYLIIMTLLPVFVKLHVNEQKQFVSVLIWFALGLSFLSLLPHVYKEDRRAGILDQIKVMHGDMNSYLIAKCSAIWLTVFLPMVLTLPVIGVLYQFTAIELVTLMIAVISGGFIMTVLGMLLMIIALGLESQQAILSIMYFPLLVPVIVLGAMSLDPMAYAVSIKLLIGGALLMMAIVIPCCNYVMRVMLYE